MNGQGLYACARGFVHNCQNLETNQVFINWKYTTVEYLPNSPKDEKNALLTCTVHGSLSNGLF